LPVSLPNAFLAPEGLSLAGERFLPGGEHLPRGESFDVEEIQWRFATSELPDLATTP
jgi:hypothetical protein